MSQEKELTEEQLCSELDEAVNAQETSKSVTLKGNALKAVLELKGNRTPSETANTLVLLGAKKYKESNNGEKHQ